MGSRWLVSLCTISTRWVQDDLFTSAQFPLDGFKMTRFPLHNFHSMGFKLYRLERCLVVEFSSTLGMIFPNIFFRIPIKLKVIFAEINFREKKWLICASCDPHKSNISSHLHHLGKGLDNYIRNYDNILLLGDFNSEFSELCLNFCDIYNLKNLVKQPAFYKNPDNPSCIDLFLTIRLQTFHCTTTIEAGISNLYKLMVTVLKTFYKKQGLKSFVTRIIIILTTTTFAKT